MSEPRSLSDLIEALAEESEYDFTVEEIRHAAQALEEIITQDVVLIATLKRSIAFADFAEIPLASATLFASQVLGERR